MPVNNEKDAYGRAVDASVGQAGDILRKMFPGTGATLRGSGEDIATSRSLPEAAGGVVSGAAALPVALADDVVGGAARALAGPASDFMRGLTRSGYAQASPPAAPRSARQILSFNTGEGGAPAFPGAVAPGDRPAPPSRAAEILSGGRVSTVPTLGAKGYMELADRLRAIHDDTEYRKAELQDGRPPIFSRGYAGIADPKNRGTSAPGPLVGGKDPAEGGQEFEKVLAKQAASRAGELDAGALARVGTPDTQVGALQSLGSTNKATAEALLKALDADTSSAPQRKQAEIVKQLLSGNITPEQAQQLRLTLLAMQGKDASQKYVLAESSSVDPTTGQVSRNQIPFNTLTGQYVPQPGAAASSASSPPPPTLQQYAEQIRARNPGAQISDQEILANYKKRFGG